MLLLLSSGCSLGILAFEVNDASLEHEKKLPVR